MEIEAQGVSAGYGRRRVLHDISLAAGPGEMVALLGPNGSGKSTLLRVLSGIIPPLAGTVLLDGLNISLHSSRERARRMAFVPQSEPAYFDFSARDIVLMGRYCQAGGGDSPEDYTEAMRALAATNSLHLAERPVTQLSGGERRRVLIARALAQQAQVILMDEPTAHLDISHQAEILTGLRHLVDAESRTVIAALHDLNLAAEYCTRVALLSEGRMVVDERPAAALDSKILSEVYGGGMYVGRNPASGRPMVLPASPASEASAGCGLRIHVICGGGTGAETLARLLRYGHTVTAGVLNRMDSDEEACAALGIKAVTEAPFSPIGSEAQAASRLLVESSDAVVITEVPFGRGNLPNLEAAAEALNAGKPVLFLGEQPFEERDFTDGVACRIRGDMLSAGARTVPDLPRLELAIRALHRDR